MKALFHPDTTTELIEAAHFYERRQEGLGDRLIDAVEEAIAFLKKIRLSGALMNREGENIGLNDFHIW